MNADGRDTSGTEGGADWLLAQLAAGRPPARNEPPVVPPPVPPSERRSASTPPVVPPPPPTPERTPAPRREEVLDWFSLADSAPSATDAATRALPIVGAPLDRGPAAEPPAPQEPAAPYAPAGLPSWTPPFAVGRPAAPPVPP
ncbi:hypothetical protein ESP51_19720, partial [Agromyces albus]